MIAALRQLRPTALRLPRLHVSPTAAVRLAFAVSAVVLVGYVARFAQRVPIHDEYSSAIYLFAEPPVPWYRYWDQHNEHRIPLPRLLYTAAVRIAGTDFRAPMYLDAALLVGGTYALLNALRRLRGGYAYADAAIPLGLLTVGQYANLLWGFQVQFISSVVLVLAVLSLALAPGLAGSRWRLAGLGACGFLLPLCGANGVAFAPGIAVALLYLAARNLWGGDRRAGVVALLGGVATLAVVLAYFHGLDRPAHHATSEGTFLQSAVGFVNLLGAAFGPVVRWLPPQPFDGVTVLGVVAVLLVAATAARLGRAALDPTERDQAVVLGGILVGFLGLAAGIAKGRAGHSNVLDANRYVSLMLPMVAGVYAAWTALGSVAVPRAVFLAAAAAAVPNLAIGCQEAPGYTYFARQIEAEIRSGMPLDLVADRNVGLYRGDPRHRRDFLALLHARGVEPFRSAAPLPALREEVVPFRVVRAVGLAPDGAGFRAAGRTGHVVLELPARRAYAIKLTYEAAEGDTAVLPNVVSWEPDGAPPADHLGGVVNQLEPHPEPTDTLLYVRRDVRNLRIDLFGEGARIVVHRVAVLTTPD